MIPRVPFSPPSFTVDASKDGPSQQRSGRQYQKAWAEDTFAGPLQQRDARRDHDDEKQ